MSISAAGIALATALFLSSLTAGFLVAFAVVVMPGIRALDDAAFLRAFQVMDRVIQENDPAFMLMWVGSILAMLAALVVGVGATAGTGRVLLIAAGALYLGGVQPLTVGIHLPLNDRVQLLDLDALDPEELRQARAAFEPRWTRWNRVRTVLACLSAGMMASLLLVP